MKILLAPCLALAIASAAQATPADDLSAAARKITEAPNYGWTSLTEIANAQFPASPVEGVAEKGGYTVTTRSFNGNTSQTVRKGTEVVMQNRDGDWLTGEELRAQFAGGGQGGAGAKGGGQRGGRGGFGGFFGGGVANPAEGVANLAAKLKDLKVVDGAIVGTAAGADAATLMAPAGGGRGGQGPAGPQYSSVTVKFWLKDGAVAKYSTHTLGKFTLPGGEERDLDSTTTIEFKNVGTTKVEVPAAALKKFTPSL